MVLVRRVVAQDVHVETCALFYERQTDAAGADDRDGLTGDLVAEKWEIRVPRTPVVFAQQFFRAPGLARQSAHHEEGKFGGAIREDVGGVGKRDPGAVDVVEANGVLGDNLQRSLPGFENFPVDGIAQRGDQAVDAATNLFDDQFFRRRIGTWVHFDFIAALAQQVNGFTTDITGRKHTKLFLFSHDQ